MLKEAKKLMTTEEFLALPDDGVRRWLIDGQLREQRGGQSGELGMTVRNQFHSYVMANCAAELVNWSRTRPTPRGRVLCGEAGIILSPEPGTTVGVDLAYITHDLLVRQTGATTLIEGVPLLIAEILSPSDTHEGLVERRALFRRFRVPLVWVIDIDDQTVTVYREGSRPTFVNAEDTLTGDPHLPGFSVPVARLFE